MDQRTDPVHIAARVGKADPEVALQVWVHLAQKAGWNVETADSPGASVQEESDSDYPKFCGRVAVEGLAYDIRLGPRLRHLLVDVDGNSVTQRAILQVGAWADPVIDEVSFPADMNG
ncbi:hypothetical protein ACWD5V_36105 [Streptomyces sp. NPDC002523]